eukprot:3095368-Pyramimonas_sp.AAC.1
MFAQAALQKALLPVLRVLLSVFRGRSGRTLAGNRLPHRGRLTLRGRRCCEFGIVPLGRLSLKCFLNRISAERS